jgi:hypothetical protein
MFITEILEGCNIDLQVELTLQQKYCYINFLKESDTFGSWLVWTDHILVSTLVSLCYTTTLSKLDKKCEVI